VFSSHAGDFPMPGILTLEVKFVFSLSIAKAKF
jgi:hypothetical protein